MAMFIMLLSFTDQGIRNIKRTTERAEAFKAAAGKVGASVKDLYWTQGQYDIVATVEAPDAEAAMSLLLSLGALGNLRTQTLRAFTAEEMTKIITKMP